MYTESSKVEVRVQGEDDNFWIVVYVNGVEVRPRIAVKSIPEGKEVDIHSFQRIVEEAYRRGYRAGFRSCQDVVKEALGIKRGNV